METDNIKQQNMIQCGDFWGVLEEVKCPICKEQQKGKLIFKRTDNVGIWKCPQCNIMYASPRFTEDSLLEIYENDAFIGDKSFYENWSYEVWKEGKDKDNTYRPQQLKIDLVSRFISHTDKILDFGCGTGLFCLEASKQGYDIEGIDTSSMLTSIGKDVLQIPLHNDRIENFNPGYKYKGIVAWAVLEHIYDLKRIITKCNNLLESGGYLFVDVPNHRGLSDRYKTFLCNTGLKKCNFKHFGFPWHIYSFDKKSLSSLMHECGFKPVLFEFRSHLYKQGSKGWVSKMAISLTQKFELSSYITLVAQKK